MEGHFAKHRLWVDRQHREFKIRTGFKVGLAGRVKKHKR